MQGCSREGEEKPGPELFTLAGMVFKSSLRSGRAGLYTPGIPPRSRPNWNVEFSLAVEMGGCGR